MCYFLPGKPPKVSVVWFDETNLCDFFFKLWKYSYLSENIPFGKVWQCSIRIMNKEVYELNMTV